MRVATVMGVLLLGGAATLSAQHAHQFEIGGYASYTRFDRAFLLDNTIGGGGRLAFWITDWLGIEGDGLYQKPHATGSTATLPVWFASGSLVLNFGSEKSFYVLGGYSAMDFNSTGVGGFRDAGAHGAIGDRIYISDRAALRLEAGAHYAPKTQSPTGSWAGQVVGSAGLSFFLGPSRREKIYPEIPKQRRDSIIAAGGKVPEAEPRGGPTYERRSSDWQHKWYWGGQGGLMVFRTNYDSYSFEPTFGGHWLITGRRTALYAAYEQSFFLSPGRRVRDHGSAQRPGQLRDVRRQPRPGSRAAGRSRQRGHEGVLLVDGRDRHQAGSACAVRPLHPDVVGGELPDPGDHPHVPGRRPLLLRERQGRDHGPAVSTLRKFSPRIFRSASPE
ncbi:MAG: hypothetical protein DMD73_12885 [Gemmatimonadetes bacterium]|nr:MAG: hypothetical protein DMD73_12885 [Gemmatimonadota bacterium]